MIIFNIIITIGHIILNNLLKKKFEYGIYQGKLQHLNSNNIFNVIHHEKRVIYMKL